MSTHTHKERESVAWARTNIHARESGVGTYTKTHTRGTGYTQKGHGIYLHMGPAPSVEDC